MNYWYIVTASTNKWCGQCVHPTFLCVSFGGFGFCSISMCVIVANDLVCVHSKRVHLFEAAAFDQIGWKECFTYKQTAMNPYNKRVPVHIWIWYIRNGHEEFRSFWLILHFVLNSLKFVLKSILSLFAHQMRACVRASVCNEFAVFNTQFSLLILASMMNIQSVLFILLELFRSNSWPFTLLPLLPHTCQFIN